MKFNPDEINSQPIEYYEKHGIPRCGKKYTEIKPCSICGEFFPRKRGRSVKQFEGHKVCSEDCKKQVLSDAVLKDPYNYRICVEKGKMMGEIQKNNHWAKGHTKETHSSLASSSEKRLGKKSRHELTNKQKEALKKGHGWGRGKTQYNSESIRKRTEKMKKTIARTKKGIKNPEHSKRLKELYRKYPERHPNAKLGQKAKGKGYTYIEKITADILDELGIQAIFNKNIGSKWVDFAIENKMKVIECDGEYWHQDPDKEKQRDEYIKDRGWSILHLAGKEIVDETEKCKNKILEFVYD